MRAGMVVALLSAVVAALLLAACTGYESEYERGVYDYEPIYCYQTIGAVDCRREPHSRDAARLVNYYGPAPGKYDPPDPPKEHPLRPPPKVKAAYRDPEPVVGLSPTTAATREAAEGNSVSAGAGEVGADKSAAGEEKSEWKEWLPLVSVAFGALQVVAAFAF
jgi:hypothetical protein